MHTSTLPTDDWFAIKQAERRVSRLYARSLADAALTPTQYSVLDALAHNGGLSMQHLSELLVIERTTVMRTLRPLLNAKLVTGMAERGNRRLFFRLTDAGSKKLESASAGWHAAQVEYRRRFGAERAARLRAVLFELGDIFSGA